MLIVYLGGVVNFARKNSFDNLYTVCPRSLDPFYIVGNCMNWVKTSCAYSK